MARTTSTVVKDILLDDYGPLRDGTEPSLTPFIDAASVVVDRVATSAAAKGKTLTETELANIESWLAAHFYVMSDQVSAEGKSGERWYKYQGQTGMMLDASKYGQTAKLLDYSGSLAALQGRKVAALNWLGKTTGEKLEFEERN